MLMHEGCRARAHGLLCTLHCTKYRVESCLQTCRCAAHRARLCEYKFEDRESAVRCCGKIEQKDGIRQGAEVHRWRVSAQMQAQQPQLASPAYWVQLDGLDPADGGTHATPP